ncbi:hypothetical protein PsAD2_03004 [Pseudovibrio axinellae]|uniref:DUF5983 domain-containing protein n=1 Tax=Pseudovibrio axinellae TaxID=989403 RepID=A0A165XFY3_9HYPH|nr:hypothetical protein [Pseudovibrio axinellae]KZL17668.1 hypothetical protein PsAD2_03004 [Pseudovibrio axinellae]SER44326.1 hypothetical protein SAMN05421798_11078 [Pseudovibrio axinellae]
MSDNVRNFLDLSTGHLLPSTRDLLDGELLSIRMFQHEYGWLLPTLSEDHPDLGAIPSDLLACIALARKRSCDYILFDRDASPDDDLIYYDDNHIGTVQVQVSEIVEYHFDMPVTQEQLDLIQNDPNALDEPAESFFTEVGAKPEWVTSVHNRTVDMIDADDATQS